MADKENGAPRLTRAAAKRAASAQAADPVAPPPAKKKRVALSELPTLSNAVPRAAVDPTTPPPKPKSKPKKKVEEADDEKVDLVEVAASSDDDPQMCAHYASDIYQYLKSMEVEAKRRPSPNYMETVQSDVTVNMRAILVDWLVEVAEEYKLVSDTLFLTVSYIDRFLSFNAINRHRLQLLGVSSMLIASYNKKMEECTGYKVSDLKDCIRAILGLQLSKKAPSLVAIRDKYKQHRVQVYPSNRSAFMLLRFARTIIVLFICLNFLYSFSQFKCVSSLVPPSEIPATYFDEPKEYLP
ncbi:hypothetical protein BHM03_00023489 [Ensete ventricosum]|nr:hypothetical protein BHM03_00023489 [Ensete ventricosum]